MSYIVQSAGAATVQQVIVHAEITAGTINLTQNVDHTIAGWTEAVDTLSAFNPTTGIFTAPSTGYYHLIAQVAGNTMAAQCWVHNITTGARYGQMSMNFEIGNSALFTLAAIASLAAGNQVCLRINPSTASAQLIPGLVNLRHQFSVMRA